MKNKLKRIWSILFEPDNISVNIDENNILVDYSNFKPSDHVTMWKDIPSILDMIERERANGYNLALASVVNSLILQHQQKLNLDHRGHIYFSDDLKRVYPNLNNFQINKNIVNEAYYGNKIS